MLALACLLSGCAALVYQILWTRQVGLVMGNTVQAVALGIIPAAVFHPFFERRVP